MHRISGTLLALALAGSASAQCDRLVQEHALLTPLGNLYSLDKYPGFVADFANVPNLLLGGSLRTNTSSLLQTTNTVQLLSVARVQIAQEQGTNNFFGLSYTGRWAALSLTNPPAQQFYGQDCFGQLADGAFHFFSPWEERWISEPIADPVPLIQESRSSICVVDGTDSIVGFSLLADGATRLTLPSNPSRVIVPVLGSSGEPLTRRNTQAFEIDTHRIAFFSTYLDRWDFFTTLSPVNTLSADYNKNVLVLADYTNNLAHVYSPHRGEVITLNFADLLQVTITTQDNGALFEDAVTGSRLLYGGVDGGVATLPNSIPNTTGVNFQNDCCGVGHATGVGIDEEWYGKSMKVRNSVWTPAGIPAGEVVLATDGNDSTLLVVTDVALYGFSANSDRWSRQVYGGVYVRSDAEDFLSWVETTTEVYALSTRLDQWVSRPVNANTTVTDSDSQVVVTEYDANGNPISKAVYSTESLDWRVQALTGPLFDEGTENSLVYSIHDDLATGGSRIYFFSAFGDTWIDRRIPFRITQPTDFALVEDGLIVASPTTLYTFMGYGDLSSDHTAPIDNYAYHMTGNQEFRLLATGQPNAAAILLSGLGRTELPLTGLCGQLEVDPFGAGFQAIPLGLYDQDGVLQLRAFFPPTVPVTLNLQVLGISPSSAELGALLLFQLH